MIFYFYFSASPNEEAEDEEAEDEEVEKEEK